MKRQRGCLVPSAASTLIEIKVNGMYVGYTDKVQQRGNNGPSLKQASHEKNTLILSCLG